MPNPDGTMTPAERQAALLGTGYGSQQQLAAAGSVGDGQVPVAYQGSAGATQIAAQKANIAAGTQLAGAHAGDSQNNGRNELFGYLSDAQTQAKQQGDFGLGSNNNAATSAMLGNAGATADKYSGQFGGDATNAGALSGAAGSRGIGMFQGNTGQYNAGLANAADDRGMQQGAYGALMNFANQGPGPSAAQAQLNSATAANTQNALAMARSGRGMGGGAAALRGAIAQNAVTQQGAVGQAAELRANENTAYQAQRLNAIGAASGQANSLAGTDQSYANLGLSGAQYHTNTALQGTQLNDATSQAWAAQQQAAQQQGLGAEMGGQTQDLNINASALAGRESQWASQNQTHGIDSGNATQAGIADANRTQAYVGAGASAAGGVISAVSDERYKMGITPLGGVQPLANQAPTSAAPAQDIASKSAADAAQKSATGAAVGGTAGSIAGGAVGSLAGPVGTAVGGIVGGIAGKELGKVFSDVRSKTAVMPMSARPLDTANPYVRQLDTENPYAPRQLDQENPYLAAAGNALAAGGKALQQKGPIDPFDDLQSIAAKYGAGGVAADSKQASRYSAMARDGLANGYTQVGPSKAQTEAGLRWDGSSATAGRTASEAAGIEDPWANKAPSGKALDVFSRSDHPILSKGDALLADSARNAPPSSYQYKDPADGQGTYVGPMAQDLARNPVTSKAVSQDPSGKLSVDGPRAALAALSQNHSQQNQLDALYSMLDDSKKRELQRASGGLDSVGNPYMQAGAN